jgi:16S rRNA (uracil1498-N3)-methyltransferase
MGGEAAHHLGRVLRAEAGQLYELSDGRSAWLARIESVARDRIEFALVEELPALRAAADVTLLLSIVKFDAFEWALEKATELGVSRIVPLAALRSEKSLVSVAAKRSERWRKILFESSQQARRLSVPRLAPAAKAVEAFSAHKNDFCVVLSERADAPPIRSVLEKATNAAGAVRATSGPAKPVALAIGPEGGWTDEELASARSAGFREASLGQLILRTETAVASAVSLLNYALSAD